MEGNLFWFVLGICISKVFRKRECIVAAAASVVVVEIINVRHMQNGNKIGTLLANET